MPLSNEQYVGIAKMAIEPKEHHFNHMYFFFMKQGGVGALEINYQPYSHETHEGNPNFDYQGKLQLKEIANDFSNLESILFPNVPPKDFEIFLNTRVPKLLDEGYNITGMNLVGKGHYVTPLISTTPAGNIDLLMRGGSGLIFNNDKIQEYCKKNNLKLELEEHDEFEAKYFQKLVDAINRALRFSLSRDIQEFSDTRDVLCETVKLCRYHKYGNNVYLNLLFAQGYVEGLAASLKDQIALYTEDDQINMNLEGVDNLVASKLFELPQQFLELPSNLKGEIDGIRWEDARKTCIARIHWDDQRKSYSRGIAYGVSDELKPEDIKSIINPDPISMRQWIFPEDGLTHFNFDAILLLLKKIREQMPQDGQDTSGYDGWLNPTS